MSFIGSSVWLLAWRRHLLEQRKQQRIAVAAFDLEPTVIPVVFEVDAQGKSTGRSINGNDWGATTAENVAPQFKAFFAKK